MNVRRSVFRSPYLSLVTALVLAMPNIASAQDDAPKALPFALGAGIMGFLIVISIAGYIYQALALQTIAQKTGTENGWFAWIPILNLIREGECNEPNADQQQLAACGCTCGSLRGLCS